MDRETIDTKHCAKAAALEADFFEIIDEGKTSQHRMLKVGKTIENFNLLHGQIWRDHRAELLAEGIIVDPPPSPPPRDLEKEIDTINTRLEAIEAATGV